MSANLALRKLTFEQYSKPRCKEVATDITRQRSESGIQVAIKSRQITTALVVEGVEVGLVEYVFVLDRPNHSSGAVRKSPMSLVSEDGGRGQGRKRQGNEALVA